MLKLRTPENVFKTTPSPAKPYVAPSEIPNGRYDEPDRAIGVGQKRNGDVNTNKSCGSDVDSGRESLSSTNAFLMEEDTMPEQHDQPKVKVVGELLKKDVKATDPSAALDTPSLNGGIDLSSLIIAKEIIIGGSAFTPKTDPKLSSKKKPSPNDAVRKKRLEPETKLKSPLVIKRTPPVEKSPSIPKDVAKSVPKKTPISRSNSKDSINTSITTNSVDKFAAKKKLTPKFSLDSKTKEIKKPEVVRNSIKTDTDRKKSSKPVPSSSLKTKLNLNKSRAKNDISVESLATYSYEFYNEAMQKKCNADENSIYKDFSSVFPTSLDSSPITSKGCTSCLPSFRRQQSNLPVIRCFISDYYEFMVGRGEVARLGMRKITTKNSFE